MSVRDGIVRAAAKLYAEQEHTTVEALLQAAGVARRTFYKHFRNQEEVLGAVYETLTRELTAAAFAGRATDPVAALRGAFDAYLTFHVDNHALLRVLTWQAIRPDSSLAPLRRRFRADLVTLLDHAVHGSTGRHLDAFVFLAFISGIEGLSLELLAPDRIDLAQLERARRTVNALLEALLVTAASLPVAQEEEASVSAMRSTRSRRARS